VDKDAASLVAEIYETTRKFVSLKSDHFIVIQAKAFAREKQRNRSRRKCRCILKSLMTANAAARRR